MMIKPNFSCKKFFLAVVLSFSVISLIAADRYSVATGDWNLNSTWSATSGGLPGASFPVAGDNVFVEGGFTVTTTAIAACANLSIANVSTLTVGGFDLAVSGTTTVNGTINHTSTTGTKTFTGSVTINATGIWNNNTVNAPIFFIGGVSNSGTFNAGTGTYTFDTNNQALTGTLSIPNVTVTGVTLTNNGTLTVSAALAGTGGLTQAVNATLNLGGTSGITTLTATNNGNTVNFSGAAQTAKVSSYYNLTLSGTGIKTFATTPTINAILSMEGTATVVVTSVGVVTYGANATLQYNTTTARTATAQEWIVPFAATGGVIIANTGTITMNVAKVFSASVPLTINSGATLATNNLQLTFGGNFVNGGTLSAGSSPIVIANTMAAQNINGFTTTGVVLLSKTAGTATFTGNVNGGGLTINGVGGTLNLGSGLTHTFTGAWTRTNGTLNGGSSLLKIGGSVSGSGGTFTAGTGTVEWYAGGAQTCANVTYYNLTISGSGNKTMSGNVSVAGTLTLTAGTFTVGTNTLTLNGPTIAGTPGNLITVAASSLSFGGSSAGISIPGSVTNLNNLTINNANGVTMNSNITLAAGGVLTLTSGIVQAGTNILKITNTNPASALVWSPGAFFNVTTGGIERTLTANLVGTGNNYSFPVGEGGVFKGINLRDVNTGGLGPVLRSSVSATGALTGDGTTMDVVYPRYWSLMNLNGGNLTSAKVELFESGLDLSKTIGMSPAVAGNYAAIGGSSISSSIISPSVLNPGPYFCIGTVLSDYYYSFQPGDWNTPTTWTSDPSGTQQVGNTVPGMNDKVVILTGRTVSLSSNIVTSGLDIKIEAGGFLNQTDRMFTNTLTALRGQGTLKLASVNFPVTMINTFIDAGGGTTEYDNTGNFTMSVTQTTYNNLTINTSSFVTTLLTNLTLNGNLYIKSGTFQINNNISSTKLTLTINGSVTVDNSAFITVGNGVTNTAIGGTGGTAPFLNYYLNFHTVIIKGDFINNGTVKFTNLPYPIYNAFPPTTPGATSGAASVYFQGASDNTLECNGITNFYNLILDKGIDQTFKLTINSTSYSNFRLFGANILATDGAVSNNPNLRKALWIRNGTLILQGLLIIPSLSEGTAGTSDYYIPSNGALVFDGVDVVVLSSADDYREINVAYTVAAPDDASIGVTKGGTSALDLFGRLQINDGFLSTRESGGIVTSSVASGQLIINDGTIDAKQFLSSTGSASYTQTGGLFILRGRLQRTPAAYSSVADISDFSATTLNTTRAINGINPAFGTFNLENTGNIYSISGGTIRIYDVAGTEAGEQEAFDVKSSSANINVTDGTLEIIPVTGSGLADAANFSLFTNAPVGNLVINRSSSTSVVRISAPMVVQNDFSLTSGDFLANNFNLTIGGDITIESGTTYTAGTNLTTLNGTAAQAFTINLAVPLSLYKFIIDKPAGVSVNLAGSQNTLTVTDNFRLVLGTINVSDKIINVARDVYNSGVQSGSGKIVLNGILPQSIDGNGTFGNVELNNNNAAAAPISLAAHMTINGALTFSQDKIFNIGTYNLKLNPLASIVNGSTTRYIQTSGNSGDGGITKVYSPSSPSFVFPIGAPTLIPIKAVKYTPATIGFSSDPSTYGSVTVIPAGYEHPATTINGQSLTYFWRVKSVGFTGIVSNSVTHTFKYDDLDIVGAEGSYAPSLYDRTTSAWNSGTAANPPINTGANTFTDWITPGNSRNTLDADYTAGVDPSFGTVSKFYSCINGAAYGTGLWSNPGTWSLTSNTVYSNPSNLVPGLNDIVVIGAKDSVCLSNVFKQPVINTNQVRCASLQIEKGSALDISWNPGSVFSMVLSHPNGNGNFRLTTADADGSTFVFPSGDFSDFNANNGTTEFYSVSNQSWAFYLPTTPTTYGTVILSPYITDNIVFPNTNVTILGNLITRGSTWESWLAMTWNGSYGVIVPKTVTVKGNMLLQGGTFIYFANGATAQTIEIDGDVIVYPGAGIDIYGTSTNNSMLIGGSLINNSTNTNTNPVPYGGYAGSNVYFYKDANNYCNVTFFGSTNASVTNTGTTPATGSIPNTTFNKVTVNKGTSQSTTLTWNIAGTLSTPVDNWLTLQNGTLRYMRTNPNSDLTISTTTSLTVPSTAGLRIDYANANNRNVLIGNAANNAGDLLLDGKLTLIRGNIYIGPVASPASNNDIEYSGGGASAIEIQGGNLVVNGQIRRNTSTTNGILNYTQSSGTVTINGNGANAGYAKLEVLNAGSSLYLSGGTLTIVRGGGTTYGDLYLRPDSSSVTGGTIIFTNVIPNSLQNYSLDANIPLNNLTITGAGGAGLNANLSLIVSPLVLNGTFTLSNPRSIFNSNNINVSVKGNLDNSGTYNSGANTTTFDGGVQIITGGSTTNFNNLNVLSLNSLTVNNNFSVGQDLFIGSGNLILGNKKVTLLGNLTNNGSYTDDNTVGGISISGTIQQQITGTGSFGRLELNNPSGAKLMNDINLQNNLVLTQGVLDINKFLLTLSQNSSITGAPFGITKMIKTNGVISDLGMRKFFTASPQSFTFPVGVSGKYTPAIYSISANTSVGYIKVNPINSYHPTVTDPLKVLNYYWLIESSGISGFNANVLLQYMPGDVYGIESDYVAAKLVKPGNFWYEAPYGPATDNVDETNNQITFSFTASNSINGEYTAGDNTAIPGEIPTYQSNKDGNWSDETIWTPVGPSPPCQPGGPIGSNVIIDHVVTIDINRINSYATTINNRLRFPRTTFAHSYGFVSGDGTLYLEEGNLPAGSYTRFTNCSGNGTIEYGGIGNYSVTIVASLFSHLPNMFFTGTGTRVLPDKDLTICKRLVIDGPTLDNSVNNYKLTILGSMERYNTGAFICGSGVPPASTVTFAGTSIQTLGGPTGDFMGTSKFNNLEINNPAGINIGANGLLEVNHQLLLTNGIISTSSTSRLILLKTSSDMVTPAGGKSNSFINGPLTKQVVNGGTFLYPIGKGTIKGHDFTLKSGAGSTLQWTVEYFTPNPTSTSLTPPLVAANKTEYWSVSTNTASKAQVIIGWDPMSDLTPLMTENGLKDMRVAEYISGSWNELKSKASGDNNNGEVKTENKINISTTPVNFTTASVTPVKARASFSSSSPVCGSAGIPVSFTSYNPISLNYTLSYTINDVPQPIINITSLPYTLPTPVPGAYKLTAFTYNNGLNTGVVNIIVVNVYADPPNANAGSDQSLCGVSGTILAGTNPAPYSGQWTVVSGSGGTFVNSTQYNSVFTGLLEESYTLRWTISNVSCTSADEVAISFPVVASIPGYFTSAPTPVCQGSGGYVYTVPNVSGNTYTWSYSGTGHSIIGTGNSVIINFNATATSGTLSVTATNACGTSAARTVNITVTPLQVATFSYAGTPYCQFEVNPSPTFSGGGVAGTFSAASGLVFISTSTGQVDLLASTPGTYTITNTIAATGGCGVVTATSPITLISNMVWTGLVGTDWNDPGNWSCGFLPDITILVQIPNVPNKPVLSAGATGAVNNLTIEPGSSLTVSGNTLHISGTITNNGTFDASAGTILMNGTSAQTIGASVFSGNTIRNLNISNAAGVSLLGPLNVTGIVNIQNGTLASDGYLTLASSASQTALIDGSGAGTVTGNVTMQRYLPSAYGYKYVSSPFQAATVNEFGDEIDLGSSFPLFYKYDESLTTSGWVNYATSTNLLNPLTGYAANFGSSAIPLTADIAGVVNNGPFSVTLYNNNNTYTQGFNLIGNPYPSPIDWDAAAGWTKTNIDDALYYFKASATDEYGGTYSTYINGISSDGLATAIIPSMQGIFIHVSDGSYPVTGILGLNNSVRVTDLTHPFMKSEEKGPLPLIRLGATFSDDPASTDPMVIYFDEKAQTGFDTYLDALKLMNTDFNVPNLYALGTDGTKLSIDALPKSLDSLRSIPLGLKTNINGNIVFRIIDLVEDLPWDKIYITDIASGTENDLLNNKEYRVNLEVGEYKNRFFLNLMRKTIEPPDTSSNNNPFTVYSTHGIVKAYINTERIGSGLLSIYNLTGQVLFKTRISDSGYYEFNPGFKDGIYIVSFVSKIYMDSRKIFIQNR